MVNKTRANTDIQAAITTQNSRITEVVCQFHVDNHDLVAVLLKEGNFAADQSISVGDNVLTEICRFKVNDYDCVIMKKVSEQESEALSLSTLLSARELQIATLVALGCPNKQVADKLHISEWTVATYLRRIFAKLGVDTRAAMTYRCAPLIEKQDVWLRQ